MTERRIAFMYRYTHNTHNTHNRSVNSGVQVRYFLFLFCDLQRKTQKHADMIISSVHTFILGFRVSIIIIIISPPH